MKSIEVTEKLKEIFALTLGLTVSQVDRSLSQSSCEKWDSIAHLNLIATIEEKFQVLFSLEEFGEMHTFALVNLMLEEKLAS
jgi:acyl carrier protein